MELLITVLAQVVLGYYDQYLFRYLERQKDFRLFQLREQGALHMTSYFMPTVL